MTKTQLAGNGKFQSHGEIENNRSFEVSVPYSMKIDMIRYKKDSCSLLVMG